MQNLPIEDIVYGVFGIAVILVAFFLIRKVASCLIKTVVMAIVLAVLGYVYFNMLVVEDTDDSSNPTESRMP